jgi:hypothetical protein
MKGEVMKTITQKKLAEILKKHLMWQKNEEGGERADLSRADLSGADLSEANLSRANLFRADLSGAMNLHYSHVPEEGSFIAWKKCKDGVLVKLLIPEDVQRNSCITGRKCRCSKATVLAMWDADGNEVNEAFGIFNDCHYSVGAETLPDTYNPDPRIECSNGIHFFITKQEALDFDM